MSSKQHEDLVQLVSLADKHDSTAEGDQVLGKDNNCLRLAWQQDVTERQYKRDQVCKIKVIIK